MFKCVIQIKLQNISIIGPIFQFIIHQIQYKQIHINDINNFIWIGKL